MSKLNILETPFTKTYNLKSLAQEAEKYLRDNQGLVFNDGSRSSRLINLTQAVSRLKPISHSYINTMFHNLVENDQLNNIVFIDPTAVNRDVVEVLTMESICIDGKYGIKTGSKLLDKAWVNLAPYMLSERERKPLISPIKDIPSTINSVVRAQLCMSYNDSDEWLPPKLSAFIVEFYTIAMSSVLNRTFNFEFDEMNFVKLAFGLYYSYLLSADKDEIGRPPLIYKTKQLFKGFADNATFERSIDAMNEIRGDREWSIDVISDILRKLGPSRMSKLTTNDIYRMFAISSQSSTELLIAIDYPPYLVHQLLKSASGQKHPIFSNILKLRMQKGKVRDALDQLVTSKQITRISRG